MPNPIIWTKMGSLSEITSPEFGAYVTRFGSPIYQQAKFDNGAALAATNNYIEYSAAQIDTTKGCFECWIIFNTLAIVDGQIDSAAPIIRYGVFRIGNGAWYLDIFDDTTTRGHALYANSNFAFAGKGFDIPANTLYHLAVVWDNSGIDGSADKLRLYINDIVRGSSTSFTGPSSADKLTLLQTDTTRGFYSTTGYECAVDNIKVWDYAKTDFSDRFTEDGLGGAKRLFSNKYFGGI